MKAYRKAILPLGFKANGVAAGIKESGKLDLALIVSEYPCRTAGQFSSNKIQAAPLEVCKEYLSRNNLFRGVIINSGNANCFTGKAGMKYARYMTQLTARELKLKTQNILVASTGIIGKRLDIGKIKKVLPGLVKGLSSNNIKKASLAIITTDKFTKQATVKFNLGNRSVTICGIAKGAGMIFPHLRSATMLAFITTDADIAKLALEKAMCVAVDDSFNSISVDGCQSTNDTVLILANAQAKNKCINYGDKNFEVFLSALKCICLKLAKLIVQDGEGATKVIQVNIKGAKNKLQARQAAFSIANSNLFKAAMYGCDPNIGRIVAALGSSAVVLDGQRLNIKFSPLNKKEVFVTVNLNKGKYAKTVYTSDLTPGYIKINAQYN